MNGRKKSQETQTGQTARATSSAHTRQVGLQVAVALLVKLYDMYRQPHLAQRLGLWSYLVYLTNGFWLTQGSEPSPKPWTCDLRRLLQTIPAALLAILLVVFIWGQNWAGTTFIIEHAVKAPSVVIAVILLGNGLAAGYRLAGAKALDPMRSPVVARTPADFWHRLARQGVLAVDPGREQPGAVL